MTDLMCVRCGMTASIVYSGNSLCLRCFGPTKKQFRPIRQPVNITQDTINRYRTRQI